MKKFDYKKWIIENKHGIINEQPDPTPGGYPPGSEVLANNCPTDQYWPQMPPTTQIALCDAFAQWPYVEEYDQYTLGGVCCEGYTGVTGQGMPQAMASTGSAAWTGDAGGTATDFTQGDFDFGTDCTGFQQLSQDFQNLICTSCDNGQVNMHCECCNQEPPSDSNTLDTGIGLNTNTPGFTPEKPGTSGGNQAPMSKAKKLKPLKPLKENIKKLIIKELKKLQNK